MDLHERQQFDFLLQVAVERFVERLEQTSASVAKLATFTDAIFSDFLLDNVDGACFILRSLARRNVPAMPAGKVEDNLIAMAKATFSDLLERKVQESMSLRQ